LSDTSLKQSIYPYCLPARPTTTNFNQLQPTSTYFQPASTYINFYIKNVAEIMISTKIKIKRVMTSTKIKIKRRNSDIIITNDYFEKHGNKIPEATKVKTRRSILMLMSNKMLTVDE